jgi:hypothetical protein
VHPRCKTLTHYFLCSGGTATDSTKSASGHVTPNSGFCIRWGLWVMYCISVLSGRETLTHYFSSSGGTGTDSKKACRGTLRRTCVFALGGIYGSRSVFRCVHDVKHRHTIFHARVRLVRSPQKARLNTLRRACVFAPSGICGLRSAFWCV